LVGDLVKFGQVRLDLGRALRYAKVAAGDLRGLQHDLGRDALVGDGLLLVGGGHKPRDKSTAEVLADDHGCDQDDADADRKAELRAYSGFEREFEARHPGWDGQIWLIAG